MVRARRQKHRRPLASKEHGALSLLEKRFLFRLWRPQRPHSQRAMQKVVLAVWLEDGREIAQARRRP